MTALEMTCTVGGQQAPQTGQPYEMQGWCVQPIGISCTPDSIEVGRTCGMSEMCGESPCLCGAQDAWQDCACNGLETLRPDVVVETNAPDCVQVVNVGGMWFAAGFQPGRADITVNASLEHFDAAEQVISVQVGAPSPAGVVCTLAVVALVAGMVAFAVRRARHALARKARAKADEEPGGRA